MLCAQNGSLILLVMLETPLTHKQPHSATCAASLPISIGSSVCIVWAPGTTPERNFSWTSNGGFIYSLVRESLKNSHITHLAKTIIEDSGSSYEWQLLCKMCLTCQLISPEIEKPTTFLVGNSPLIHPRLVASCPYSSQGDPWAHWSAGIHPESASNSSTPPGKGGNHRPWSIMFRPFSPFKGDGSFHPPENAIRMESLIFVGTPRP